MRPGKPQLFATLPGGTSVFGLPGNPLSAAIGLHEFVLPGLRLLAGCPMARCRPLFYLPLATAADKTSDVLQIVPAILETGLDGTRVRPRPPVGSADLVTASKAHGVILLAGAVRSLPAGTMVPFRPWGGMCR
jgi:molybdopterin molybdotransferase